MKIRILAVVPYNGIKEIMNELVENDKDIELTVHIGTLQQGLKIVQSYDLDDFDIIIARGGTADLIEKHVNIPVVRIEISVYDILRAIKLAETCTSHYAIVGVLSTIENAILLRNLLQYDIKIVALENVEDDRQAISARPISSWENRWWALSREPLHSCRTSAGSTTSRSSSGSSTS